MSLSRQQLAEKKSDAQKRCDQLRENIYHWRTSEVEYESLKESIAVLDENSSHQAIVDVTSRFGRFFTTEKDALELTGAQQGVARSRDQVLSALSRRLDYVHRNINDLEKQKATVQLKIEGLEELDVAPDEKASKNDQLPVTEVIEELDEEGNVIRGSTKLPEHEAVTSKLFERIAQLGGLPEDATSKDKADKAAKPKTDQPAIAEVPEDSHSNSHSRGEDSNTTQSEPTNHSDAPIHSSTSQTTHDSERQSGPNVLDKHTSTTPTEKDSTPESNPKQEDNGPDRVAISQIDESPEDAELRREIMQYSIDEVGAIVGQLDLEETGSQSSYDYDDDDDDDEGEDDYYEDYDDDYEPEEDDYGRSKNTILSDGYIRRMRTLEEKYRARGLQNIGSDPDNIPKEVQEQLRDINGNGASKSTTSPSTPQESSFKTPSPDKSAKKKVAFADSVEVAPPAPGRSQSPSREPLSTAPTTTAPTIVSDSIVERESDSSKAPPPPAPTKRSISRFKSARQASAATEASDGIASNTSSTKRIVEGSSSSPPPDQNHLRQEEEQQQQPLLGNLVEREVANGEALPPDPDEIDENLHRQEVLTEFYCMRNRKIQEQGGFSRFAEEGPIVPLDDNTENADPAQPTRKVSRFKAARLKNQ